MSDDHSDSAGRSGNGRDGRPLPPPAFPPGSELRSGGNSTRPSKQGLERAFISPDEPLGDAPTKGGFAAVRPVGHEALVASDDQPPEDGAAMADDDAFISPDEPIPHRDPVGKGDRFDVEGFDPGDVIVTGMGDEAHLSAEELAFGADPYVGELVAKVSKLAEALKQRGEAGLRTTPGMDRFEATLRGYCVGYLVGRRVEEEEGPEGH